jgi:hypothetical protein
MRSEYQTWLNKLGRTHFSTWELAFNRHRDGLFSTQQWEAWDEYFIVSFTAQFPANSWAEVKNFYAEDFQSHIDAA